jgi:hypothetical protein
MFRSIAPIAKSITIVSAKTKIVNYFDEQARLTTATPTQFFPSSVTRDDSKNNYVNNPMPGSFDRTVIGLSISLVNAVIKTATNVDPLAIANALRKGYVKVLVDQSNTQILHLPIDAVSNFDELLFHATQGTLAAGAAPLTEYTWPKALSPIKLPEPFTLKANQTFKVEVGFAAYSAFHADAALQLRCEMSVIEPR